MSSLAKLLGCDECLVVLVRVHPIRLPISLQFAIKSGLHARLETLYAHMTFARFAQGLAVLHR